MATQTAPPPVDRYMDLVRAFPLRPIRDDEGHRRAIEILDRIIDLGDNCTREEEDYLVVLGLLVEHYEDSIYEHPTPSGAELLRSMFDDDGLTPKQLSEETGIAAKTLTDIVKGKRNISPKVRQKLAERFRMPPSCFL